MTYRIIVTCPEETKPALMAELQELGATNITSGYKAVDCTVTEEQFYNAHLKLRTASRILRVIKEFAAADERMLFDQAKRINWPALFDIKKTFLVEGVPGDRGEEFLGSNDISKKVREALQHVFRIKTGEAPVVDLKETDVTIVAFVRGGRCILSFDTAGKTLHKRGFRVDGHPAPIKETLAAAILRIAGYDGTQVFFDPMCGSGTIAIEAAYIALNKSPQIHRKRGEFGFEQLLDFNRELWRKVQEKARAERLTTPPQMVYAADINQEYVELARKIALRARVERDIHFARRDFLTASAPPLPAGIQGLLVTNLPYGERIGPGKAAPPGKKDAALDPSNAKLQEFYKALGDKMKKDYQGWRCVLMAAESSPYKFIGLKPSRKVAVLNGSIPAKLLIFDIYSGSKSAQPRTSRTGDARGRSTGKS